MSERDVAKTPPGKPAETVVVDMRKPADPALRAIAEWRGGKLRALRTPAAQDALETVLPELVKAVEVTPKAQEPTATDEGATPSAAPAVKTAAEDPCAD